MAPSDSYLASAIYNEQDEKLYNNSPEELFAETANLFADTSYEIAKLESGDSNLLRYGLLVDALGSDEERPLNVHHVYTVSNTNATDQLAFFVPRVRTISGSERQQYTLRFRYAPDRYVLEVGDTIVNYAVKSLSETWRNWANVFDVENAPAALPRIVKIPFETSTRDELVGFLHRSLVLGTNRIEKIDGDYSRSENYQAARGLLYELSKALRTTSTVGR